MGRLALVAVGVVGVVVALALAIILYLFRPRPRVLERLQAHPGLSFFRRDRWVAPAAAAGMARAGDVAAAAGHRIAVGQASRPGGGPFPPHVSHQAGLDVDISYGETYPSPAGTIPPAWWIDAVKAAAPTKVLVHAALYKPLVAAGLPAGIWPGHRQHAHLRWLPS